MAFCLLKASVNPAANVLVEPPPKLTGSELANKEAVIVVELLTKVIAQLLGSP